MRHLYKYRWPLFPQLLCTPDVSDHFHSGEAWTSCFSRFCPTSPFCVCVQGKKNTQWEWQVATKKLPCKLNVDHHFYAHVYRLYAHKNRIVSLPRCSDACAIPLTFKVLSSRTKTAAVLQWPVYARLIDFFFIQRQFSLNAQLFLFAHFERDQDSEHSNLPHNILKDQNDPWIKHLFIARRGFLLSGGVEHLSFKLLSVKSRSQRLRILWPAERLNCFFLLRYFRHLQKDIEFELVNNRNIIPFQLLRVKMTIYQSHRKTSYPAHCRDSLQKGQDLTRHIEHSCKLKPM